MRRAVINPAGRLDVLLLRMLEECTRRILEPAVSRAARRSVSLWPLLEGAAHDAVAQLGIPRRPITLQDLSALAAKKRRRNKCTR